MAVVIRMAAADEWRICVTIDDEFLSDRSVRIPVEIGGHPVYVEAVLVGGAEDEEVAARVPSFGEFTEALGSVTRSVADAVLGGLGKVKPAKVGVEFGCEVGVEWPADRDPGQRNGGGERQGDAGVEARWRRLIIATGCLRRP